MTLGCGVCFGGCPLLLPFVSLAVPFPLLLVVAPGACLWYSLLQGVTCDACLLTWTPCNWKPAV